jgi:hypothetical protein
VVELVSLSHWGLIEVTDAFERDMAARCQRCDDGDRGAILEALYFCLSSRKPVPDWASRAFCRAYADVIGARAESWNDVFGEPWKGKHLKKARDRKDLEFKVWFHGVGLREKLDVDEHFFEKLGSDCGIGARQAKEMYYEIENAFPPTGPQKR